MAVAGIDGRVAALVVQVPAMGREPPLSGAVEPSEGEVQGPLPVVSDDQVRDRRPCNR